jgi:hypothetical protein
MPYNMPKDCRISTDTTIRTSSDLNYLYPYQKMLNAEVLKPPDKPCTTLFGRVSQFNMITKQTHN